MKWLHHTDQMTAEAARKLGFIRRNLRVGLRGAPVDCTKLAYITLVRPRMEYASIIWDHHAKCDSEKLERVQVLQPDGSFLCTVGRPVLHFTSLLQRPQLEPPEERRRVQRLVFMYNYKILNDHVAVPAASVDLILSSRPSRGVDANSQKL